MTDYLLLYSGGSMPETPEAQAAVMAAWNDWMHGIGDALKDGGNPFTPSAKSIAADGSVSEGPGGSMASGYSIIKADSWMRRSRWRRAARSCRAAPRSRCSRPSP